MTILQTLLLLGCIIGSILIVGYSYKNYLEEKEFYKLKNEK